MSLILKILTVGQEYLNLDFEEFSFEIELVNVRENHFLGNLYFTIKPNQIFLLIGNLDYLYYQQCFFP